ncbi:MAG: VOC family protein [Ornithinibacter sp.]
MYLENLAIDAHDPGRLGRFWQSLLGTQTITDEPDLFETRLIVPGGVVLDLCFPRVPEVASAHPRLHLDLRGGDQQADVVGRALQLGARHLDIGQGDVPWVVLADPEANPFCVMESRAEYQASGPIAALPLDSADPQRDGALWAELSGWDPVESRMPVALRHPSGRGPLLELCHEAQPKRAAKNRVHLDIRLERGDDPDAVVGVVERAGGRELHPDWGDLPWRVLEDPSGNELCLLPARRA